MTDNDAYDEDDALTDEERDLSLDAIALVRMAAEDRPQAEVMEALELMLEPKDFGEVVEFLWSIASLGGALVNGWFKSLEAFDPAFTETIEKPTVVLDTMLERIVGSPTQKKES